MKVLLKTKGLRMAVLAIATIVSVSCEGDELEDPSFENVDNTLSLDISEEELELQEQFISNELSFNWTTGSNQGTGASIRYTLEIDQAEGDFSAPLMTLVEEEKNRFSTSIDHGTLNHRLLENGMEANETVELQARLTAEVSDATVEAQTATASFQVSTFKPVSNQLFIVGDASPAGWDMDNAIQLEPGGQRAVFVYEGSLKAGMFKFAVNNDGCFCQDFYTRDAEDAQKIVYNEGGSGDDLQWEIEEEGNYRLEVDLLNQTIEISTIEDAPFSALYIIGDATESGFNIDSPVAFEQNEEDPFVFEYEGNLNPGEMKIFAGPLGDWCGEWYRPLEAGQPITNEAVDQNSGCEVDNTWNVTEETAGRYKIKVNTANNTVRFEPVNVFIVGDGSPSGWDIATPQALEYDGGDFVFTGALGAENPTGEIKFSKYQGDWCDGEWIESAEPSQSLSNTEFIITAECQGPDNKWKLQEGEAGNYEIRINLDTETMSIQAL